jgi:hypothetical protein
MGGAAVILCEGCQLADNGCPIWSPSLKPRYCVEFQPRSPAWREAAVIHHKAQALAHSAEARRLDEEGA